MPQCSAAYIGWYAGRERGASLHFVSASPQVAGESWVHCRQHEGLGVFRVVVGGVGGGEIETKRDRDRQRR